MPLSKDYCGALYPKPIERGKVGGQPEVVPIESPSLVLTLKYGGNSFYAETTI